MATTPVRLNLPAPQPVDVAQLGFNVESTFNTTALTALKASGATIARWQPSWGSSAANLGVESTVSPGTYSLGAPTEAALAYCGANGIQVIAVCAFGAPFTQPLSLTVGAAGAAIGDTVIPISSGNLGSIVTPTDYLVNSAQATITSQHGYYGGLIDSVNSGGGTLTLASGLTVAVISGQTLHVNRGLYAAPADQLLTNPSLIAYFNYVAFVAGRMAANGVSGWVALWNEPPWGNDPWDGRLKFYDSISTSALLSTGAAITSIPISAAICSYPNGKVLTITDSTGAHTQNWTLTAACTKGDTSLTVTSQTPNFAYVSGSKIYPTVAVGMNSNGLIPMLKYCLAGNLTLPTGIRVINGATDKTGNQSMVFPGAGFNPTSAQVAASVTHESIHPYNQSLVEGSLWDPTYNDGANNFQSLNPIFDVTTNFRTLARLQSNAGVGLRAMTTECGTQLADDTMQAIYLLRRTIASWAARMMCVIYSFSTNDGANYGVTSSTFVARTAYTALTSLTGIIAALGGSGGSPSWVPYLVGWQDQTWPLMGCGVYGRNGAVMFVWQRSGADDHGWKLTAPVASGSPITALPASGPYQIPSGTLMWVRDPNGINTTSCTTSAVANPGDTSVAISSVTPGSSLSTGSIVIPQEWSNIPRPSAAGRAQFAVPAGKTVQSVTDVLTGSAVAHSQAGNILTVSAISDSPTAIVVA